MESPTPVGALPLSYTDRFQAQDANDVDLPPKRQNWKACEQCHKSKTRCVYDGELNDGHVTTGLPHGCYRCQKNRFTCSYTVPESEMDRPQRHATETVEAAPRTIPIRRGSPVDATPCAEKRKRRITACEKCHKSKKRCTHHMPAMHAPNDKVHQSYQRPISSQTPSFTTFRNPSDSTTAAVTSLSHKNGERAYLSPYHISFEESQNSRFDRVSNPERARVNAASQDGPRRNLPTGSIGVWHTALSQPPQDKRALHQTSSQVLSRRIHEVILPSIEKECLSLLPPAREFKCLTDIYFREIHPIFPVVNEQSYKESISNDPGTILLEQAICLAASKSLSAISYLRLVDDPHLLSCRVFGHKLTGAMKFSIDLGFIRDPIVLIQATTLMSQFAEDLSNDGIPSQMCAKAVYYVQSIEFQCKSPQNYHGDQYQKTLLCCVWASDRMNAAFYGRPILMHERDQRKDLNDWFEEQEPCFALLICVMATLDKIIDLYRPSPSGKADDLVHNFPSFDDMVLKCNATQIGMTELATIELLYHAVAILSSRTKSWTDPERSSNAYLRQSISGTSICSLIQDGIHDRLVLFPLVPYTLSLAMSIMYREMRQSTNPLQRGRVRDNFERICSVLSELEVTYQSASKTVALGRRLLAEIDRSSSSIVTLDHEKKHYGSTSRLGLDDRANVPNGHGGPSVNQAAHLEPCDWTANRDAPLSMSQIDMRDCLDPAFDLDAFDESLQEQVNPCFYRT